MLFFIFSTQITPSNLTLQGQPISFALLITDGLKVAVTGASGQMGVYLCQTLVAQGYEVKALVRKNTAGLHTHGIQLHFGDVTDACCLDSFIKDAEVVFHLAGIVPVGRNAHEKMFCINVYGTEHVVEACIKYKVRRLVYFSSIHAFRPFPRDRPMTEMNPLSDHASFPYEQTKAQAQGIIANAIASQGLDAVIVNPTSVLGPFDYLPSVKGKMLIDFYNQKIPLLIAGGFDWCDTRDVVNGAISAMEKGRCGECYILGGKYYTLVELADTIGSVTGKKTPKLAIPSQVALAAVPLMQLWSKLLGGEPVYDREAVITVRESNPNVSSAKAMLELDYTCRPLAQTLADTYQWFRETGHII